MQGSERAANQSKAEAALDLALVDITKNYSLTTSEVCQWLSALQLHWTGYLVRDERETEF